MRSSWVWLALSLFIAMLPLRIDGPMGVTPTPTEEDFGTEVREVGEGGRVAESEEGEDSLDESERFENLTQREIEKIKEDKRQERAIASQRREHAIDSGAIFQVRSRGRTQELELALDEVWLDQRGGLARVVSVERQLDATSVGRMAETLARSEGAEGRLVLYPAGDERSVWNRHVLSGELCLEWDERPETREQLKDLGLVRLTEFPGLPGWWLAQVDGGLDAPLSVSERAAALPGVRTAEVLLATQKQVKTVPNDPLFSMQWHLRNTGQRNGKRGVDASVVPVWERFQGEGIQIGVIDDGVQLSHPDLEPNRATTGHFDWNDNDNDPSPVAANGDFHGTSVAGVSSARGGNNLGVVGVAPLSQIVGLRLIAKPSTDAEEAEAMLHLNDQIFVKNNSWGPPDVGTILGFAGAMFTSAVATATSTGRGGKGTLFIWSAGNGEGMFDNVNKDAYANNRHVMAVGAVTNRGGLARYSEEGSCLVVSAPSSGGSAGVVTTDLVGNQGYNRVGVYGELVDRDYTRTFGGTSASAPVVSGVAALMLEANPDLGWRDVNEIFLRSSRQLQPKSSDWVTRTGGRQDLSRIKHHHGFGGGMVDARAAVEMAEAWENLPPAVVLEETWSGNLPIPDGGAAVELEFDFSGRQPIRVEDVEVVMNIPHTFRGDLLITLVSPSGAVSRLIEPSWDDGQNYNNWTFASVRHWGESSLGIWKLRVQDRMNSDLGRVTMANVRLHGVEALPVELLGINGGGMIAEGQPALFTADTTGYPQILHEWTRDGVAAGVTTDAEFRLEPAGLKDAGFYAVKVSNVTGSTTSLTSLPLWVVQVTDTELIVNEGKSIRLTTRASGPGLSHRWYRDNMPLDEAPGRTGVFTPSLFIQAATEEDEAVYSCLVSAGDSSLMAGDRDVRVRLKPVIKPQVLDNGIVSGPRVIQFEAESETLRFFAKRLPPGMKLNSRTGELSGRPTRAGDYLIEIWATNAAGRGLVRVFDLNIEPFPESAVGSYDGLVSLSEEVNGGLGGRARFKITQRGGVSGVVLNGKTRQVFKGLINAVPGGGDPDSRLEVKRRNAIVAACEFDVDLDEKELRGKVRVGDQETTFSASKSVLFGRDDPATAVAGHYTTRADITTDVDEPISVPQGVSFFSVFINARGRVTSSGRLGDGSVFTSAGAVDRQQSWAVFQLVARRSGAVAGRLKVHSDLASAFANNSIEGDLTWRRLPGLRRDYPAGFGPLSLECDGAKYFRPSGGEWVMQLENPVTMPNGVNAIGDLFEGGISGAAMGGELNDVAFAVAASGKAVVVGENPASITVRIQPRTGATVIRVKLVDDDPLRLGRKRTRPITGFGLVVKGGAVGGFQLVQIPELWGSWSQTPILSGGWRLRNVLLVD